MDLATLGLAVDSREVRSASDELRNFQREAGGAQTASQRFEAQAGRMEGTLASLGGTVGAIASALGVAFGGAAFVTGMFDAVKRLEAINVASRKIDKALQNNGYTAELTTKKILAFADALERRTGRGAQEVLDITPNLASFQFTEEVALRSIALADDMAAAWGGDLRQNFEGLGRALADPVKGFAMLSARGITLDSTQKKLVKSLMETGQGLKAQQIVLDALEAQVKGVAEAGYTPLTRAQDNARKSIEKFFEKLVSSQGAGDALIRILNGVADAVTFLGDNLGTITTALGIFAAGHIVSGIVSIVGAVQTMTATMGLATAAARALSVAMAFAGGPVGLAVVALGAAYLLLRDNVSAAQKATKEANSAYGTNAQALKAAERASGGYSQALRDQIAMQVEVARSAYTMAKATYESALATRDAFRAMTGIKFAPVEYNYDKAFNDVSQLDIALGKLEAQLEKVDKNLGKSKPTDRNFGSGDDGKASERAARAYRDLIKSADDRIAQMKLEAEVAGMTGIAADALRFKLDLLQKGEETGRTLSPTQIAEIEKKAAAYRKYAEAAARATLQQDLLFERAQLGRSAIDQAIAGTLYNAGLPVDFNSYEAGLIRTNEQLKIAKDLSRDFAQGFISDILSGKSAMDALSNALGRVADKLIEMATDELFSKAFGGGSSGSGGGLFDMLGSLLGGFGGGGGFSGFEHAWTAAAPGLWAKGGAFENGISGFSNTVVNRATPFMFAKGAGIMGEAGPEAIMPLKRDSQGRLGVAANQNSGPVVQIIDQRTGGTIEREDATGPNGEQMVRLIVKDELKAYGAGSFNRHVSNHNEAKKRIRGY